MAPNVLILLCLGLAASGTAHSLPTPKTPLTPYFLGNVAALTQGRRCAGYENNGRYRTAGYGVNLSKYMATDAPENSMCVSRGRAEQTATLSDVNDSLDLAGAVVGLDSCADGDTGEDDAHATAAVDDPTNGSDGDTLGDVNRTAEVADSLTRGSHGGATSAEARAAEAPSDLARGDDEDTLNKDTCTEKVVDILVRGEDEDEPGDVARAVKAVGELTNDDDAGTLGDVATVACTAETADNMARNGGVIGTIARAAEAMNDPARSEDSDAPDEKARETGAVGDACVATVVDGWG